MGIVLKNFTEFLNQWRFNYIKITRTVHTVGLKKEVIHKLCKPFFRYFFLSPCEVSQVLGLFTLQSLCTKFMWTFGGPLPASLSPQFVDVPRCIEVIENPYIYHTLKVTLTNHSSDGFHQSNGFYSQGFLKIPGKIVLSFGFFLKLMLGFWVDLILAYSTQKVPPFQSLFRYP